MPLRRLPFPWELVLERERGSASVQPRPNPPLVWSVLNGKEFLYIDWSGCNGRAACVSWQLRLCSVICTEGQQTSCLPLRLHNLNVKVAGHHSADCHFQFLIFIWMAMNCLFNLICLTLFVWIFHTINLLMWCVKIVLTWYWFRKIGM